MSRDPTVIGASKSDTKVGVIGLGKMGWHFANRLHSDGWQVLIHTRTRDKASELEAKGMLYCHSPSDLAASVKDGIIIICVTDTPAVESIITEKDGILEGVAKGCLIIDMGTTQVMNSRAISDNLNARAVGFLDAPVSGGAVGAEQGTLSIMVGGTAVEYERALPLFHVLGENINHIGNTGAGQIAKTANQMIVAMTIDAVAEALTLASQAGADPGKVRDALIGGFADSRILELHGKRMIDREFSPGARATVQLKDIKQAQELATHCNVKLPGLENNLSLWQRMVDVGLGDLDQAGFICAIESYDAGES